jgi:hypothetical protein
MQPRCALTEAGHWQRDDGSVPVMLMLVGTGTRSLWAAEDIGQQPGGVGAYSVYAKLT